MSCVFACARRFGDSGVAKAAIRVSSVGGVRGRCKLVNLRALLAPEDDGEGAA